MSRLRAREWLLRLVVALEVLVFFGAALMHFGVQIALGPLVLGVPCPLPAAGIAETILGLAAVVNLVVLMRLPRSVARMTLGLQLFMLAGVAFGMFALSRVEGPPPSPNWSIHFVMLIEIVTALVLLAIPGASTLRGRGKSHPVA